MDLRMQMIKAACELFGLSLVRAGCWPNSSWARAGSLSKQAKFEPHSHWLDDSLNLSSWNIKLIFYFLLIIIFNISFKKIEFELELELSSTHLHSYMDLIHIMEI